MKNLLQSAFPVGVMGVLLWGHQACLEEWEPLLDETYWIWADKEVNFGLRKNTDHLFSREYEIPGTVRTASLRVTADQTYTLIVNGKDVGSDDNVVTLETYDIKPFLLAGRNRIVIRARTRTWHGGLFAAGFIDPGDGQVLKIQTDDTWDCEVDGKAQKAELVIQGVNGGFWNNCGRLMEMPETFYRLNTEMIAPGIPWAKPYGGEGIRVLTIQPRMTQRDTVELIHRSDMQVTAVYCDFDPKENQDTPFFPNRKGCRRGDVLAAVRDALQVHPAVIILGTVEESVFYEVMADRLKELVRNGAGLIFTSLPARRVQREGEKDATTDPSYEKELTGSPVTDPPPFLVTGIPFEALPGFRITAKDKDKDFRKVAALFQFGKGRVARLNLANDWGLFANASDPNDLHYEYYISFAIKLILWAAGREPQLQLRGFPSSLTVDRDVAGTGSLAFELVGAPGKADVSLAVRSPEKCFALPATPLARPGVHRGESVLRPIHEALLPVPGDGPVRFALPALPVGDYFLDVVVTAGGRKVNWATAPMKVTSRLGLAEVRLDPPYIDVADGREAQLRAKAALLGRATAGSAIRFAILDNDDRLVATQELPLDEGSDGAEVAFPIRSFGTTLGRVRAELRVQGSTAALAVGRFSAIRRDWDRFFLFAWRHDRRDHAGNLYGRVLAGLGFDAARGIPVSFENLEVADLVALPGYEGTPRDAFDLDPKRLDQIRAITRKMMDSQLRFDPVAYYCGNEIDYGGGDALPFRIDDLRKNLRKKYDTIEALNRQWDSDYTSFDDIYPIGAANIPDVPKERLISHDQFLAKADETRNYSRHVDQWLNNYRAFMDQNRIPRKIIQEFDPHARIGVDCPMWPFARSGHDWYTHMQEFEMFAPYGREGETQPYEDARSFARPGAFLGLEYGGYLYNAFVRREELTDVEWHRWRVWHGLLRGFTSVWWYNLVCPGHECNLSPGLVPYPTLQAATEEIRRIRQGYYALFTRAKRNYGPIAIHYSIPSRLCCPLMPDMGVERPFNLHMLLKIMRNNVGYPYTMVADRQILQGELGKYRVLLMPTSLAVGEAEAAELDKFVQSGGILIADARPGIVDEHGKWNPDGTVSRLFGITFRKELGRKMVSAEISGAYKDVPFRNKPQKLPVDPAVELKGARAAVTIEGVPLVTWNDKGTGTAICLNMPFNYYRGFPTPDHLYRYLGDPNHNRIVGSILSAILRAHQIPRPVEITEPVEWPGGLDTPYHMDGEAQYISFTKERVDKKETSTQVGFRIPKPGHGYDSFDGTYLGNIRDTRLSIAPGETRVFAIFPYQLTGIEVRMDKPSLKPGDDLRGTVLLKTDGGTPGRHFVHLEVRRPDGQPVRYLERVLQTAHGEASFSIPLALNEPKGGYALTFTDVATRVKTLVQTHLE